MAYEHKPGSFSLFKNKDKTKGDNRPDFNGDGMHLDGTKFRAAVWLKKDKNDNWMMSGKLEPPREQQGAAQAGGGQEPAPVGRPAMSGYLNKRDMDDDSIPF
jgi:hypothetical protein